MGSNNESNVEVIFNNNIKNPAIQPFGRRILMISLSITFFVGFYPFKAI
jgi:hypothetical protein